MKLSKHFKLEEFERSETARRLGIDNTVPKGLLPNMEALCQEVLEPARAQFKTPIIITSGYRCGALNAKVRGATNSQHMNGEAADFKVYKKVDGKSVPDNETLRAMYKWMVDNLQFDQLIWEVRPTSKWIHVSYKRTGVNRQQVFTCRA